MQNRAGVVPEPRILEEGLSASHDGPLGPTPGRITECDVCDRATIATPCRGCLRILCFPCRAAGFTCNCSEDDRGEAPRSADMQKMRRAAAVTKQRDLVLGSAHCCRSEQDSEFPTEWAAARGAVPSEEEPDWWIDHPVGTGDIGTVPQLDPSPELPKTPVSQSFKMEKAY